MEKFNDAGEAMRKAALLDGVVLKYSIHKNKNGKYEIYIYVYDVFDQLTKHVFVKTVDCVRVRDIVTKNENTFYEDIEYTDNEVRIECDSFIEAKEKFREILEKIVEDRKKVRLSCRESGYIVF